MKKTLVFGSLFAVFLLLMVPNISAVEYDVAKQTKNSLLEEYVYDLSFFDTIKKPMNTLNFEEIMDRFSNFNRINLNNRFFNPDKLIDKFESIDLFDLDYENNNIKDVIESVPHENNVKTEQYLFREVIAYWMIFLTLLIICILNFIALSSHEFGDNFYILFLPLVFLSIFIFIGLSSFFPIPSLILFYINGIFFNFLIIFLFGIFYVFKDITSEDIMNMTPELRLILIFGVPIMCFLIAVPMSFVWPAIWLSFLLSLPFLRNLDDIFLTLYLVAKFFVLIFLLPLRIFLLYLSILRELTFP